MFKLKAIIILVLLPFMSLEEFFASICEGCNKYYTHECRQRIEEDIVSCRNVLQKVPGNSTPEDVFVNLMQQYDSLQADNREHSVKVLLGYIISNIDSAITGEALEQKKKELFAWSGTMNTLGSTDENSAEFEVDVNAICMTAFSAIHIGLISENTNTKKKAKSILMMIGFLNKAGDLITVSTDETDMKKNLDRNIRLVPGSEEILNTITGGPEFEAKWGFNTAREIHYQLFNYVFKRIFLANLPSEEDFKKYGLDTAFTAMWSPNPVPGTYTLIKEIKKKFREADGVYDNSPDLKFVEQIDFVQKGFKEANRYFGNILSLIHLLPALAQHDELWTFKVDSLYEMYTLEKYALGKRPKEYNSLCESENNAQKARGTVLLLLTKLEEFVKFGFYFHSDNIIGSRKFPYSVYTSFKNYFYDNSDKFGEGGLITKIDDVLDKIETLKEFKFMEKFKQLSGRISDITVRVSDPLLYASLNNHKDDDFFGYISGNVCSSERVLI